MYTDNNNLDLIRKNLSNGSELEPFFLKQKCEDYNFLILHNTHMNYFFYLLFLYYLSCKVVDIFMVILCVKFYDN